MKNDSLMMLFNHFSVITDAYGDKKSHLSISDSKLGSGL